MAGLSLVFVSRAYTALQQAQLHWRFGTIMLLSALLLAGIAFYYWKTPQKLEDWFSHPKQMGLTLLCLGITCAAALLPQKAVDYVNLSDSIQITSAVLTNPVQLSPGNVVDLPQGGLTLLDWMQRFSSPDIHPYQGAEIDVTGFVGYSTRTRTPLGQFLVNRMTLTCCIQDPVPVGLPVEWKTEKPLAENTWVRVQGVVNIVEVNGEAYPEVVARQVDFISQPNQPYLFPK
jgi:uncharacterized repeat protein (TIGR03943 family)